MQLANQLQLLQPSTFRLVLPVQAFSILCVLSQVSCTCTFIIHCVFETGSSQKISMSGCLCLRYGLMVFRGCHHLVDGAPVLPQPSLPRCVAVSYRMTRRWVHDAGADVGGGSRASKP